MNLKNILIYILSQKVELFIGKYVNIVLYILKIFILTLSKNFLCTL